MRIEFERIYLDFLVNGMKLLLDHKGRKSFLLIKWGTNIVPIQAKRPSDDDKILLRYGVFK